MPYNRRPLNPLTPFVNQVVVESNAVNENFEILARAFLNEDPTTGVLKSDVYTFRRVNLSNATSDYELQVGEEAIYTFSTSSPPIDVPLRIATVPYGVYQILIFDYMITAPSSGLGHYGLLPNNTRYSDMFMCVFTVNFEYSTSLHYYTYITNGFCFDRFIGGLCSVLVNVHNRVAMFINSADVLTVRMAGTTRWLDKTTPWTSLGTMVCNSTAGLILVRRLA